MSPSELNRTGGERWVSNAMYSLIIAFYALTTLYTTTWREGSCGVYTSPRLCCEGSQPRKLKATTLQKGFHGSRYISSNNRPHAVCHPDCCLLRVLSDETYKLEVAAFMSGRWAHHFSPSGSRNIYNPKRKYNRKKNLDVALQALISYLGIETSRLFELTSRNELITARFWEKF